MARLPTYEYHCDSCDQNFDVVQAFEDDPLTACPTCGSPVRKVFGNVGIVFKGTGFYKNDSRTKTPAKTGAGESSTASSADSDTGRSGSESSGSAASGDASPSKSDTSNNKSERSNNKPESSKKPAPAAPAPTGSGKDSGSGSSSS